MSPARALGHEETKRRNRHSTPGIYARPWRSPGPHIPFMHWIDDPELDGSVLTTFEILSDILARPTPRTELML